MSSDHLQDMMIDGGDGTNKCEDSQQPVKTTAAKKEIPRSRLCPVPAKYQIPDTYDDMNLEYSSSLLRSLEKHLPAEILKANKDEKARFMCSILSKYSTSKDCMKAKKHKKYREKIMLNYKPIYKGLYEFDPKLVLLPSFRNAISENTEESFRDIISEPFPGVFVFQMFQPKFFEKLLLEVENFRTWASKTKLKIRRPNANSKHGVVLDDFGLDVMLKKLMEDAIYPLCKVFFPDVCGPMFNSHLGLVVEYGEDKDADLGIHVEDSEITLNVCMSKECKGGELYFRGTRCEKHILTAAKPEELFEYCHVPGQAILHRGRHAHGAKPTTSGHRSHMILWCKSSVYREMQNHLEVFPDYCGQCAHEKKENKSQMLAVKKKTFFKGQSGAEA